MEIKLKLNEVLNINRTLAAIIDDSHAKINVLLKFRLLGLMKAIEAHVSNFEFIKNEKIVEYGEKNKDGTFQISKDDIKAVAKYKKDIEQVLNSDVTICVAPFKPDEIFDKGLKSEYLSGLYPIIRE